MGYFSVQEVGAAIQTSRRDLARQMGNIERFLADNDMAMTKIRVTLVGSRVQADVRMLSLLKDAETALRDASRDLAAAQQDLSRVLETL